MIEAGVHRPRDPSHISLRAETKEKAKGVFVSVVYLHGFVSINYPFRKIHERTANMVC